MGGKEKQASFKIVDIIPVNCPDTLRNDAVYQTMADIADRIMKMKGDLKTPPE